MADTTKKPAFVPVVKKNLTLPLLKPELDTPVYVKVDDAMFVGKEIKSDNKMEAATLINCTNLETGEACQMIVPAVLKGIFEDEYENDGYVGKGFAITKHAKAKGKRYHAFSVAELELPSEA